jgi:hypothetical protein
MPINKYLIIGFFMVLAGAVLPFLIVIGIIPSTLFLNFLAYFISVGGLFLGFIGMAMYVGEKRRKRPHDQDDQNYDE